MCIKSLQSYPILFNSMGRNSPGSYAHVFSRQEYWTGLLCPPPGDLPDPGTKPVSLMSPALAGRSFTTGSTWEIEGVEF